MRNSAHLWEELLELVSRGDSFDATLPLVLDRAMRIVRFEVGSIFLLDSESRLLRLAVHKGISERLAEAYREIPLGEGIIGEAAEEGTRFVVHDTEKDDRVASPRVREDGIRSFLTVPIISRGNVLGVFDVGTREDVELTGEQVSLASAAAHQIGVMLDNARLLIRSRQGERLYRHLLDNAPDLTFLCDPDLRLIRMNRGGLRFFRTGEEDCSGIMLVRLLGEEACRSFEEARDRLIGGSREGFLFERALVDSEGGEQTFEFQSSLLREEGDRFFLHFVGRNLTRRKELESRLFEFTEQLSEIVERRTSELQEAKKQIAYLFDVATRIHRPGSLDEKLRLIVRSIAAARLFRKVWIRVFDREGRPSHSAVDGFTPDEVLRLEELAHSPADLASARDEAVRFGASFFCSREKPGPDGELSGGWREGDILVVPLPAGDESEPIGSLIVDQPVDGRRPTEETIQLIELFVSQAAHAVEQARLGRRLAEASRVQSEFARRYELPNLVGATAAMEEVFESARRLAQVRTSVLISGESGTGKDLVARAIHYGGPRRAEPFIQVNCGAIPETLLESELFGIERGVATAVDSRLGKFELADGGTLFLDEVGDMSLATQSKVLRALQERAFERVGGKETIHVNVRIIAATNRDLPEEIEAGRFRRDLYYRLNVVSIHLPPLRERRDDIPLLVDHLIGRCADELGKPIRRVPPDVMELFRNGPWPGNVRQLRNCLERAFVIGPDDSDSIRFEDLPLAIREWGGRLSDEESDSRLDLHRILEERERELVSEALRRSRWIQKDAARLLGISERAIWYRVRKLGISIPSGRTRR